MITALIILLVKFNPLADGADFASIQRKILLSEVFWEQKQ